MTTMTQTTSRNPFAGIARAWARLRHRGVSTDARVAIGLGVVSTAIAVGVTLAPDYVPITALSLPVVIGSLYLNPRSLPWYVIYSVVLLTWCVSLEDKVTTRLIAAVGAQFGIALVVLLTSFQRSRLGVAGMRGESMFVDLRDRILDQGYIPDLPDGWEVDTALYSAGGTAFAGDFLVAAKATDGRTLQVVVVDVSGKGEEAGTRALLLSGAFGGLLGAMPADGFLPAANEYLLRQDWAEGFATAIHLWADLETGDVEVRSAGHPPAAYRRAAEDAWSVLRTEGPVLGLMEDAEFTVERITMAPGDSIMLYTDGMVEVPNRDIDLGIDALVDEAEVLLRDGAAEVAERLVVKLGSKDDDRALLVVHRR